MGILHLSFRVNLLIILLVAQTIFLIAPHSAYSIYVAQITAEIAKDSILIFDKDRTKIFVLYHAENLSDVQVYGRLLDVIEPYRSQNVKILPHAVGSYSGDSAQFLTYATDIPDWNVHEWLSIQEHQKLAKELKTLGLDIGDIKDLPYVALIAPKGRIVGQWKGSEDLFKIHDALKTLGFSKEPSDNTSIGDDFVKKTEPIYHSKLSIDESEIRSIEKHFENSDLANQLKFGGELSINKLSVDVQKEAWFINDISEETAKCGNYYIYEVSTPNMKYKHLYCIVNNEAKLIASHSDVLDQLESFIKTLYQKRNMPLSRQYIMSQLEGTESGPGFMIFFVGLSEKNYDLRSLVVEINNSIRKNGMVDVTGGVLRLPTHGFE